MSGRPALKITRQRPTESQPSTSPEQATVQKSGRLPLPLSPSSLLLTAEELAAELRLSERTVRRLDAAAKLPAPVSIGATVRWKRSDIDAWVLTGCPNREKFEADQSLTSRPDAAADSIARLA